eukprot:TRINITY_DN5233_c0_g1_i1.p1 TRINITY_DN5233_c0_g1~~TRINITY_DN5233_c0_g1_i1.p1  ORF type:complete len:651 (+),score=81.74 TRINITY_DN5233_c0_g1_i1:248-2200(+)
MMTSFSCASNNIYFKSIFHNGSIPIKDSPRELQARDNEVETWIKEQVFFEFGEVREQVPVLPRAILYSLLQQKKIFFFQHCAVVPFGYSSDLDALILLGATPSSLRMRTMLQRQRLARVKTNCKSVSTFNARYFTTAPSIDYKSTNTKSSPQDFTNTNEPVINRAQIGNDQGLHTASTENIKEEPKEGEKFAASTENRTNNGKAKDKASGKADSSFFSNAKKFVKKYWTLLQDPLLRGGLLILLLALCYEHRTHVQNVGEVKKQITTLVDQVNKVQVGTSKIEGTVASYMKEEYITISYGIPIFDSSKVKNAAVVEAIQNLVSTNISFQGIIFYGSPGSGKTTVISETLNQALKANPKTKLIYLPLLGREDVEQQITAKCCVEKVEDICLAFRIIKSKGLSPILIIDEAQHILNCINAADVISKLHNIVETSCGKLVLIFSEESEVDDYNNILGSREYQAIRYNEASETVFKEFLQANLQMNEENVKKFFDQIGPNFRIAYKVPRPKESLEGDLQPWINIQIDKEMAQISSRIEKIVKRVSNGSFLLNKAKDLLKKIEKRNPSYEFFPIDPEDKVAAKVLCKLHILRNHPLQPLHYMLYSNLARTVIFTRFGELKSILEGFTVPKKQDSNKVAKKEEKSQKNLRNVKKKN